MTDIYRWLGLDRVKVNGKSYKIVRDIRNDYKVIEYETPRSSKLRYENKLNIVYTDSTNKLVFPEPVRLYFNDHYAIGSKNMYKRTPNTHRWCIINGYVYDIGRRWILYTDGSDILIDYQGYSIKILKNDMSVSYLGKIRGLPVILKNENTYICLLNEDSRGIPFMTESKITTHKIGGYTVYVGNEFAEKKLYIIEKDISVSINPFVEVKFEQDKIVTENREYNIQDILKADVII